MRTPYTVYTANHRVVTFRSTNHLLRRDDVDVRAGKTASFSRLLPRDAAQTARRVSGGGRGSRRAVQCRPVHGTENLFNWLSAKASTIFATKTPVVVPQSNRHSHVASDFSRTAGPIRLKPDPRYEGFPSPIR
jgi:hypothetical protein